MSNENTASGGTHWWDHYYVRYFVGAIFGAALLFWLQTHARVCAGEQCKIGEGFGILQASALGTIGLAFCYMASAPILVLHATRFLWRDAESKPPRHRWIFECRPRAIMVVIVGGFLWVGVWAFLALRGACKFVTPTTSLVGYVPIAMVLVLEVFLLCKCKVATIQDGYLWLARARACDEKTLEGKKKGEFIESYRHLREHGNAYAILLAELALTLAISVAPNWYVVGGLLTLWILPAAFVWFIATQLEFQIDDL